jgi:hypothetical protein
LPTTRSVGRQVCLVLHPPAVSGTYTDATLTRTRPHTLRHPIPPLHTHISPSFSHPTSASQLRARCRAMMKITAAHTALASQLKCKHVTMRGRSGSRLQDISGAEHTGRRASVAADTLLTGLQTITPAGHVAPWRISLLSQQRACIADLLRVPQPRLLFPLHLMTRALANMRVTMQRRQSEGGTEGATSVCPTRARRAVSALMTSRVCKRQGVQSQARLC